MERFSSGFPYVAQPCEARQCDTPGCSNPALDHMVQIAPGTNVRVCQGCADAMFAE